jgi:hypothetical protein
MWSSGEQQTNSANSWHSQWSHQNQVWEMIWSWRRWWWWRRCGGSGGDKR